jgi:hypothetical protein
MSNRYKVYLNCQELAALTKHSSAQDQTMECLDLYHQGTVVQHALVHHHLRVTHTLYEWQLMETISQQNCSVVSQINTLCNSNESDDTMDIPPVHEVVFPPLLLAGISTVQDPPPDNVIELLDDDDNNNDVHQKVDQNSGNQEVIFLDDSFNEDVPLVPYTILKNDSAFSFAEMILKKGNISPNHPRSKTLQGILSKVGKYNWVSKNDAEWINKEGFLWMLNQAHSGWLEAARSYQCHWEKASCDSQAHYLCQM